jgi:2-dehydro-3-deoxy-D-arabinonate dehydratase
MKLGQIRWKNTPTAALFEGGHARPIPDHTLYDLIRRAEVEGATIQELAVSMASKHAEPAIPVIPVKAPEVWACGCTYEGSSVQRDADLGERQGLYAGVYQRARPEIFIKGTARVCVGPGKPIGIRADSQLTVPEPELAVVLGSKGAIVGYTLANDVSAWDIAKEHPFYLTQAKSYAGSCALGPIVVTADEIPNPHDIQLRCTIQRGERIIFEVAISTSRMSRRIEELTAYLIRSNPVPCGSLLLTGTGVFAGQAGRLEPGDLVTISAPEIGELSNPAAVV